MMLNLRNVTLVGSLLHALIATQPTASTGASLIPYDGTNPVIYDNDGAVESGYTDKYIYALQSAGHINLVGIISASSYGEADRQPPFSPLSDAEMVTERQEIVEKARRSGLRNLPNVTAGPSLSLQSRRPASDVIDETQPFRSPAAQLIVSEAMARGTRQKPLVIVMGGQATAVADAYLMSPSIADRIIVAWVAGNERSATLFDGAEYNLRVDPWASYIVFQRLKVVLFPNVISNDPVASTPKWRLPELPDTELRQHMVESLMDRGGGYIDDFPTDVDAMPAFPLTRSDYVRETKFFSFSHFEVTPWDASITVPTLKEASGCSEPGPNCVLIALQASSAVATEEWWMRMNDPLTWGPQLGQIPYGGTPWKIPGSIEAENFDEGGTGRAYLDDSNNFLNVHNPIRALEHVDIYESATASGGLKVGSVKAGEWIEYTVNVPNAGSYTLEIRVASNGAGGRFHVELNSVDKTGTLSIPDTGGWNSWRIISKPGLNLAAGTYVMRLVSDSDGPTGYVGDFDAFTFKAQSTARFQARGPSRQ